MSPEACPPVPPTIRSVALFVIWLMPCEFSRLMPTAVPPLPASALVSRSFVPSWSPRSDEVFPPAPPKMKICPFCRLIFVRLNEYWKSKAVAFPPCPADPPPSGRSVTSLLFVRVPSESPPAPPVICVIVDLLFVICVSPVMPFAEMSVAFPPLPPQASSLPAFAFPPCPAVIEVNSEDVLL